MQSKADEYREKARACERMAGLVRDEYTRQTYLEIARQWRELANHVEREKRKIGALEPDSK